MLIFGKALVLPSLSSALLRKVIRFRSNRSTILLRQLFFIIISLPYRILILFSGVITELLKVGSVVECPFPPVVVNPLSVSIQPNGKKRLILDLRHVNFFCQEV